jgi:hypothetical protein
VAVDNIVEPISFYQSSKITLATGPITIGTNPVNVPGSITLDNFGLYLTPVLSEGDTQLIADSILNNSPDSYIYDGIAKIIITPGSALPDGISVDTTGKILQTDPTKFPPAGGIKTVTINVDLYDKAGGNPIQSNVPIKIDVGSPQAISDVNNDAPLDNQTKVINPIGQVQLTDFPTINLAGSLIINGLSTSFIRSDGTLSAAFEKEAGLNLVQIKEYKITTTALYINIPFIDNIVIYHPKAYMPPSASQISQYIGGLEIQQGDLYSPDAYVLYTHRPSAYSGYSLDQWYNDQTAQ